MKGALSFVISLVAVTASWALTSWSQDFPLTPMTPDATHPRVIASTDGYLVVWQDDTRGADIWIQRLGPEGRPQGGPSRVNPVSGDHADPSVAALHGGGGLVVWLSRDEGVLARAVAADGMTMGPAYRLQRSSPGLASSPQVAGHRDGHFLAVWREHRDPSVLVSRVLTSGGMPLGMTRDLVSSSCSPKNPELATRSEGGFVVVWETCVHQTEVKGLLVDRVGTAVGGEFVVGRTPGYLKTNYTVTIPGAPTVATSRDASFIVAWLNHKEDLTARQYDPDGRPRGPEFRVSQGDSAYWLDFDWGRVDAAEDGSFLVAWPSTRSLGGTLHRKVLARRFSSSATPLTHEMMIGSDLGQDQFHVDTVVGADRLLSVWSTQSGLYTNMIHFDGPNEEPHLLVPVVARIEAGGVTFVSRGSVFNSGPVPLAVELVYTPRLDIGGASRSVTIEIQPLSVLAHQDVLAEVFEVTHGAGSLIATVRSGPPVALSVETEVVARHADGSEYRQRMAGRLIADSLATGTTAQLFVGPDPEHQRINVGLVGLNDGTRIDVTAIVPPDQALGSIRHVHLNRGQSVQINDLVGVDGEPLPANALVRLEIFAGSAHAYGSLLDGRDASTGSSDAITMVPFATGHETVTLLSLGGGQGVNELNGSGSIANLTPERVQVEARFHRRGVPGAHATATFDLDPHEVLASTDLVGELFSIHDEVGTVVIDADQGAIAASGRQWTVYRYESGTISGTAGKLMEGLTHEDLIQPGQEHAGMFFTGLDRSSSGGSSNLAIFNPGPGTTRVRVTGFGGPYSARSETLVIRPEESILRENIVNWLDPEDEMTIERVEVAVDGYHPVHARLFHINRWGDPLTIAPVPVLPEP